MKNYNNIILHENFEFLISSTSQKFCTADIFVSRYSKETDVVKFSNKNSANLSFVSFLANDSYDDI